MKKVSLLVLCAVALGAFQPGIMAVPSKANVTIRLKNEYSQFKESMKCFKQKGWKGCTPAQRKRIAVAGVALTALIVAVVGGGTVLGLKRYKHLKKLKDEKKLADEEGVVSEEEVVDEEVVLDKNKFFYAVVSDNMQTVEEMIKNDSEIVNVKNSSGATPLHYAAGYGKEAVARVLIDNHAVVDKQNSLGSTPLHFAAGYGYEAVVKLLIKHDAEVSQKDITVAKTENIEELLITKMAEQQK